MIYKFTLLNTAVALFLIGILIYTIWNYEGLAAQGGWGILAMLGLAGVGVVAGLADFFLQQFIKNRTILNVVGLAIAVGVALWVVCDM